MKIIKLFVVALALVMALCLPALAASTGYIINNKVPEQLCVINAAWTNECYVVLQPGSNYESLSGNPSQLFFSYNTAPNVCFYSTQSVNMPAGSTTTVTSSQIQVYDSSNKLVNTVGMVQAPCISLKKK